MPDAQPVPTRNVWLLIACSMVMAACLYALVLTLMFASGPPAAASDAPLPRALFWGAAAAFVVASMLWTQFRVRAPIDQALSMQPPAPLFTPAEFQLRSIISLALAEAACVVGFVQAMMFRTPVRDFLPFGAATVLVIVLDVIPTGLKYWSSRDT